uniref:Uncharacterized protein n=1 Tax=Romanomermis culicivorax TaxID=13658 RepID=A0A915JV44_ROMCU
MDSDRSWSKTVPSMPQTNVRNFDRFNLVERFGAGFQPQIESCTTKKWRRIQFEVDLEDQFIDHFTIQFEIAL